MSTGRHADVSIISYISLENKGVFMGCDQQHSEYPKYQLSQIDKSSMSAISVSGGGNICKHAVMTKKTVLFILYLRIKNLGLL